MTRTKTRFWNKGTYFRNKAYNSTKDEVADWKNEVAWKMTIVYAVVARSKTVLAEFTSTSGNFPTVTRVLLSKIPKSDTKMSYVYDAHEFHYLVDNGITFLCMANQSNRRVAFAFLEDAKLRFLNLFGTIMHSAPAFTMNDDFAPILQRQMTFYNGGDLTKVKSQLDDVKSVVVENIEKVLERGEKIELLVDKTERLNDQAFKFHKTSSHLRSALFWKNVQFYAMFTLIVSFVVFVLVMLFCGGITFSTCRRRRRH